MLNTQNQDTNAIQEALDSLIEEVSAKSPELMEDVIAIKSYHRAYERTKDPILLQDCILDLIDLVRKSITTTTTVKSPRAMSGTPVKGISFDELLDAFTEMLKSAGAATVTTNVYRSCINKELHIDNGANNLYDNITESSAMAAIDAAIARLKDPTSPKNLGKSEPPERINKNQLAALGRLKKVLHELFENL